MADQKNKQNKVGLWKQIDGYFSSPADLIKTSHAIKVAQTVGAFIAFIVAMLTVYQINLELTDLREEREARKEEAIARAWNRLTQRASGNTGKGRALSFLAHSNERFDGVDLSCRAIGDWDFDKEKCLRRVLMPEVKLNGVRSQRKSLYVSEVNLSDIKMLGLRMQHMALDYTDFSRAVISRPDIVNSEITANWQDAEFRFANLIGSRINHLLKGGDSTDKDFVEFTFTYSNISGSIVPENALSCEACYLFHSWADNPPAFEDKDGIIHAVDKYADRFTWCNPPVQNNGKPIPLSQRPNILINSGDTVHTDNCADTLTYQQAKTQFPESHSTQYYDELSSRIFD
jgi:hypothetical protein